MPTVTVSRKGWVVIPSEYRKKYRVEPGTRMEVVDYGGGLSLVPALSNPVADSQGLLRSGSSLTRALRRERVRERNREDKR